MNDCICLATELQELLCLIANDARQSFSLVVQSSKIGLFNLDDGVAGGSVVWAGDDEAWVAAAAIEAVEDLCLEVTMITGEIYCNSLIECI